MAVSSFVWLDHRQEDAERVRQALAALEDPGMVDPLGFGVIRDAFSDMLFPGTSTIQTRARYFLFVPWIFQELHEEGVRSTAAASRVRQLELDLIQSLLRGDGDAEGIIGSRSWPNTKQLPSFVYWGGLGAWRIRRFAGTRYDYFQSLDRLHVSGDEQADLWHPTLPPPPDDLFDAATLNLDANESEFLRDQILTVAPDSFLAILARDGSADETSDTPWEHPQAHAATGQVGVQLRHAKLFAIATWGAGLLYNDRLSELLERDGLRRLEIDFRSKLDDWLNLMTLHERELSNWDREEFWYLVRRESLGVTDRLVSFLDWWLDSVVADPEVVVDNEAVYRELAQREASIKGARSKLANQGARQRSASAQGHRMQRYRWPQVQQIVADIQEGLES